MLPLLTTIGQGLAMLATYIGQMIVAGFSIGTGFWASKKMTGKWDLKGAIRKARKIKNDDEAEVAGAVAVGA